MPKISERPASEDSEEGEASDGVDPSPSRDTRLVHRDPLRKVNDKTRADHTEKARKRGLEEGIEIGKRGSAEKIKAQDTLIKEQNSQIKRLIAELALESGHLLLAGQRSDLSATLISAHTADNRRQCEETTKLEQRVALLTGQLAQKTEEVETVTAQNARLHVDVAALSPSSQSRNFSETIIFCVTDSRVTCKTKHPTTIVRRCVWPIYELLEDDEIFFAQQN